MNRKPTDPMAAFRLETPHWFQILRGGHQQADEEGYRKNYRPGEVVRSEIDLVKLHGKQKFRDLGDGPDKPEAGAMPEQKIHFTTDQVPMVGVRR